jgi:lipopolysaccharide export system protein LptA
VIIDLIQIDAEGNKKVYHGKAKHAVFDTKKNTCVLTGWPRISEDGDDGPQELVGQEESSVITLDRVEERVWGDRCKTRLNGGSLNAPKKKPAR